MLSKYFKLESWALQDNTSFDKITPEIFLDLILVVKNNLKFPEQTFNMHKKYSTADIEIQPPSYNIKFSDNIAIHGILNEDIFLKTITLQYFINSKKSENNPIDLKQEEISLFNILMHSSILITSMFMSHCNYIQKNSVNSEYTRIINICKDFLNNLSEGNSIKKNEKTSLGDSTIQISFEIDNNDNGVIILDILKGKLSRVLSRENIQLT
jgi:hypothetical protein